MCPKTILHRIFQLCIPALLIWAAACEAPPQAKEKIEKPNPSAVQGSDTQSAQTEAPQPTVNQTSSTRIASSTQKVTVTFTDTSKPAATYTPFHTPSPAASFTPADTLEPTIMAFTFEELLRFQGIPTQALPTQALPSAEIKNPCDFLLEINPNGISPDDFDGLEDTLCIPRSSISRMVALDIYGPDSLLVDSLYLNVNQPWVPVPFRFDSDLPIGEWQVTVSHENQLTSLTIPHINGEQGNFLSLTHTFFPAAVSPVDPRRQSDFRAGERLVVQGFNFQAKIDLPVAIYREPANSYGQIIYTPMEGIVLRTSSDGAFDTTFNLESYEIGNYMVVAFMNLDQPQEFYAQTIEKFSIRSTSLPIFINNPPAVGDDMQPEEVLYLGHSITSANNQYTFVCQPDGNLVLYETIVNQMPLWSSYSTNENVGLCVMQGDGNLVIYDQDDQSFWATNTFQNPGSRLVVQNDANVVIYGPDDTPIWSTNTYRP